jgi:hypothetical protein
MLRISHKDDAGFFSCCSIKLEAIINYFNENKKLPSEIDGKHLFKLYKPRNCNDITYHFF